MNHFTHHKSSLFLMELLFAILFFALGSSICVQIFIKAHQINKNAQDLSFASSKVSETVSVLQYSDADLLSIQKLFPCAEKKGNEILIFYDSSYELCNEKERKYTLHFTSQDSSLKRSAHIWMTSNYPEEVLYELNLHYPVPSIPEPTV